MGRWRQGWRLILSCEHVKVLSGETCDLPPHALVQSIYRRD
jgi:hypothetical protein